MRQWDVEANEHAFISSTFYRFLISITLQPLYPEILKSFVKFWIMIRLLK